MKYQNIVVLTGAGISAESGIPVFRSETGLWENYPVEDVATYDGFRRDKKLVHDFYNMMRRSVKTKQPNAAHLALTKLQQEWHKRGGKVSIVTQNIDDLHEKAGSQDVIHMHGELFSLLCEKCGKRIRFEGDSSTDSVCPFCKAKAMRPDIVWFGEVPYHMDEIAALLYKCNLFLSIGTSGVVYPAAGFCQLARQAGAWCVEFNLDKSLTASNFQRGCYGKASVTVPEAVDKLLSGQEL